ncbi:MAG: TFIIB-type zinc ribbon-containing protein, partial [Planctomycetota bacterium]
MTGPDEAATATTPARFPCEQCGAGLAFSPGTTQLVCPYCGHDNEIPEQAVETWEQDYRAKLAEIAAAAPVEDRHVFKCQGCRAEVTPASHVSALACPFCGADLIEADADRRLVRPTLLAPFHVTREAAWTAYRAWV